MSTINAIRYPILLSIVLALFGAGIAHADTLGPGMDETYLSDKDENAFHTSELIGETVSSKEDDEEIGAVKDLIVDEDGSVIGVTVGIGGFLGIGDKTVAIAWDALELSGDQRDGGYDIRVDADRESLSQAVEYEAE